MRKWIPTLLCAALLSAATLSHADDVSYVNDNMEVTLRSGTSTQHQIVRMLPTGAKLTVLETDAKTGYTRVRTDGGTEGWILTRYLTATPPAKLQLAAAQKKLSMLQGDSKQVLAKIDALQQQKNADDKQLLALKEQNAKLSQQLSEIRRVSSHSVQIADENSSLKQRLMESDRDNQRLRQENQALQDRSRQNWFAVGAITVVVSMLLGIILTRVRWRRRSGWGDL